MTLATAPESSLIAPDPLELAAGWVVGTEPQKDGLRWRGAYPPSPRQVLEDILLSALARPPCVVEFSGGRDSSLVLAVATHVARREGLPLPIPYTRRFLGDSLSNEGTFPELVVSHLQLSDWDRHDLTEELDLVGDLAQRFLQRHGVVFPAPMFIMALALEAARGGSRVTGEGGDEVFAVRRPRHAWSILLRGYPDHSQRHLRSSPARTTISALLDISPTAVRQLRLWRRYGLTSPHSNADWLRPLALQRFALRLALEEGKEPLDWRDALRWHLGRRVVAVHRHNTAVLAASYDVMHVDPLLDPRFVSSLARVGGAFGFSSRADAMKFVAGDLLPAPVLERKQKAFYNLAFFTSRTRSFAKRWDGSGVDTKLVDPEALRRTWLAPVPSALSGMLLQTAWLAERRAT